VSETGGGGKEGGELEEEKRESSGRSFGTLWSLKKAERIGGGIRALGLA